jgi:hypothetical protein
MPSRMGKTRRHVEHLRARPSRIKRTGVLHSGQTRMSSSSFEMDTGILLGAFALVLALYQSRFDWANAPHFGPWVGARCVLHTKPHKREESCGRVRDCHFC